MTTPGTTSPLPPYTVRARNPAAASENRIHDDDVARRYGFAGGLVPGVTVYAYLCRPVVEHWGTDWLERGWMTARFHRPCYEGEEVTVEAVPADGLDGDTIELTARRGGGDVAATAVATLPPEACPSPPIEQYPRAPLPVDRPPAGPDSLAPGTVLGTVDTAYGPDELAAYLAEVGDDWHLFRTGGYVHPGDLLRCANRALSDNVRLEPWMHVESGVTHLTAVREGEGVATRGRVARLFERKGHHFVELDLLLVTDDGRPAQHVRHTSIYRIRPPEG